MNNFHSRLCLECNEKLTGRSDKRFCDAYCRNAYHNRHKADDELLIKTTNQHIRRNRRILKTLCPVGKATVRKEVLDQMGYDYRYFSSLFKTSTMTYYLVYDYGFAPISDKGTDKVLIVQHQDYMNQPGFDIWRH